MDHSESEYCISKENLFFYGILFIILVVVCILIHKKRNQLSLLAPLALPFAVGGRFHNKHKIITGGTPLSSAIEQYTSLFIGTKGLEYKQQLKAKDINGLISPIDGKLSTETAKPQIHALDVNLIESTKSLNRGQQITIDKKDNDAILNPRNRSILIELLKNGPIEAAPAPLPSPTSNKQKLQELAQELEKKKTELHQREHEIGKLNIEAQQHVTKEKELNDLIADLEKKINDAQQHATKEKELNDQIAKLEKDILDKEDTIKLKETENKYMLDQNTIEIRTREDNIKTLQTEKEQLNKLIEDLKSKETSEVDDYTKKIEDLNKQITNLNKNIEVYKQKEKELTTCNEQITIIRKEKEDLEKQHTTLTDSITKKEKEIFIARNAITSLQQTQKDCTDQVAQLEAKLLRAQSDEQALNDKYKTENGDLQKKISDLNAQIANLTSTHTGNTNKQKEEVQKLVAQLTALQKAKDDSDKTCRDEQTQLQREKDDINAKLETNKKDITILNEKINTLNGEVSSQKTINKTLQDDITAKDGLLTALTKERDDLKRANDALTLHNTTLEDEKNKLLTSKAALDAALIAKGSENTENLRKLNEANNKSADLDKQIAQLKIDLQDAIAEVAKVEAEKTVIESKITTEDAKYNELKTSIGDLKTEFKTQLTALNSIMTANAAILGKIVPGDPTAIADLNREISDLKAELAKIKGSADPLTIAKIEKRIDDLELKDYGDSDTIINNTYTSLVTDHGTSTSISFKNQQIKDLETSDFSDILSHVISNQSRISPYFAVSAVSKNKVKIMTGDEILTKTIDYTKTGLQANDQKNKLLGCSSELCSKLTGYKTNERWQVYQLY